MCSKQLLHEGHLSHLTQTQVDLEAASVCICDRGDISERLTACAAEKLLRFPRDGLCPVPGALGAGRVCWVCAHRETCPSGAGIGPPRPFPPPQEQTKQVSSAIPENDGATVSQPLGPRSRALCPPGPCTLPPYAPLGPALAHPAPAMCCCILSQSDPASGTFYVAGIWSCSRKKEDSS